ncbi:MAG: serine/threonine-protein kinase RsbW [Solirubrobacteraceae bacterium]|jgi:stage II sporulation protein AB (anti-sigma F factor)|nr:serine/threonine-protein kinase RsbW [Solirubrobacteraceae bacterium]
MGPTDSAMGLDASYPAHPLQVATIRRAVSHVARRCGAGPATLIRLELAVSEAATNAVLHAYRTPGSGGPIHVTAHVDGRFLDVCVRDSGVGMSPRVDSPGLGLGLSLMAHESDSCEIRSAADGGTEVYMRFELVTSAPSPHRRRFARADALGAPATG